MPASTRDDPRFTFGTGKLGDLAGFTSAIILAMIALLIGYEAVTRLFAPVPIHFAEAIPIAVLGLAVNVASAWLLGGGGTITVTVMATLTAMATSTTTTITTRSTASPTPGGALVLERLRRRPSARLPAPRASPALPAWRPSRHDRDGAPGRRAPDCSPWPTAAATCRAVDEIPEPHAFTADGPARRRRLPGRLRGARARPRRRAHRDNNMRAAVVHVMADAAVSVLVIVGLLLARAFGWLWMDPLAGIVGACVIASWSYGLIRDTGAILLDMNPDRDARRRSVRQASRPRATG